MIGLLFIAGSLISLQRARRTEPTALRDDAFVFSLGVVFALQMASPAPGSGSAGRRSASAASSSRR